MKLTCGLSKEMIVLIVLSRQQHKEQPEKLKVIEHVYITSIISDQMFPKPDYVCHII